MKKCKVDGCESNVFSNLFCKYHQYLRIDTKAIEARNKPMEPRSAIRPYKRTTSDKSELKTTKSELMQSWGFKNQKEMFNFVWLTRPHICQISGSNLDLVPEYRRHWCCSHLIAKGLYPFFKLNEQNILLIDPDVHQLVDNFTEDMREKHKDVDFDKWFSLVEKQKQKYKDFLIDNML